MLNLEKNTDLIIINAQNGDKAAFQELYQEVYKDLYHYALFVLKNKQDAEDVVADTVVDAFTASKNCVLQLLSKHGYLRFFPLKSSKN